MRDRHTRGPALKFGWYSTGKKRTFLANETLRTLTTHQWIYCASTHTDWSTDEESSGYWRPSSSGGAHEVLWPSETPSSPSGLRTTLKRLTVLKISSLTFTSSQSYTNQAAAHRRSEQLYHNHLKHTLTFVSYRIQVIDFAAVNYLCAPSGQWVFPSASSVMKATWLKSESCEIRTASDWLNNVLFWSWRNLLKPVARHAVVFPCFSL